MTMTALPPVLVERRCLCLDGSKRLPLRRHAANAEQLIEDVPQLQAHRHLRLLDYRCPKCKTIISLTLGDLLGEGLSPSV